MVRFFVIRPRNFHIYLKLICVGDMGKKYLTLIQTGKAHFNRRSNGHPDISYELYKVQLILQCKEFYKLFFFWKLFRKIFRLINNLPINAVVNSTQMSFGKNFKAVAVVQTKMIKCSNTSSRNSSLHKITTGVFFPNFNQNRCTPTIGILIKEEHNASLFEAKLYDF